MKKMMVLATVAMIGIAVNAAEYDWASYGITSYGKTSQESIFTGKIYLMDAATMSQDQMVANFAAGMAIDALTAGNWNYMVTEDGYTPASHKTGTVLDDTMTIAFDNTTYGTGAEAKFYQVAYDALNKALYVSELIDLKDAGGVTTVGANYLLYDNTGSSAGNIFEGKTAFVDGGWYTAVPEPTSGLLLLLGVAGLALKRRRA